MDSCSILWTHQVTAHSTSRISSVENLPLLKIFPCGRFIDPCWWEVFLWADFDIYLWVVFGQILMFLILIHFLCAKGKKIVQLKVSWKFSYSFLLVTCKSLTPSYFDISTCRFSNLGNTCYMNAILQSLFGLNSFTDDLLKPELMQVMQEKNGGVSLYW